MGCSNSTSKSAANQTPVAVAAPVQYDKVEIPPDAQGPMAETSSPQHDEVTGAADSYPYHLFVTHEWNVHEKARELVALLKRCNLRVWFDDEQMLGDIKDTMQQGIDDSAIVLVCVTMRYIEKVNKGDAEQDNCKFEFKYARQSKMFVPVIMDLAAKDPSKWFGPVKAELASKMFYDMTDLNNHGIFQNLIKDIHNHLGKVKEVYSAPQHNKGPEHQPKGHPSKPNPTPLKNAASDHATEDQAELDEGEWPKGAVPELNSSEGEAEPTQECIEEKLPPIVFEKLKQPSLQLTPMQSIQVLLSCVQMGQPEARKARDQHLLIVIGSTGAGKSTFLNYLHGCSLEAVPPHEVGETGFKKVIRVKLDSEVTEMMTIGHSKESQTLIPVLYKDILFAYLDCPGFLDNRGAEINIANAVNIKQTLHQAMSALVVILLDSRAFESDRSRGITNLMKTLSDMFGGIEAFKANSKSILVGLTNLQPDNDVQLVFEHVCNTKGVHDPIARSMLEAIKPILFVYDPLDRGTDSSWTRRDSLISKLKTMVPIHNPKAVFKTVLNIEDESALRTIIGDIQINITNQLQKHDFNSAAGLLETLERIDIVDNAVVSRLLFSVKIEIRSFTSNIQRSATLAIIADNFELSQTHLDTLTSFGKSFQHITNMESVEELTQPTRAHMTKQKKENEKFAVIQRALHAKDKEVTEDRERRDHLENQVAMLVGQKKSDDERVAAMKEEMEAIRKEKDEQIQKVQMEYEKSQERFKMESSGEENKKQLQEKLEVLQREQQRVISDLQSSREKEQNAFKKKLEENEKVTAAKNEEILRVKSLLDEQRQKEAQSRQEEAQLKRQQKEEEEKKKKENEALARRQVSPVAPGELLKAAENGDVQKVEDLIDRGANLNERNENQRTPLHLAARNGHTECVAALLKAGADKDARDKGQDPPARGRSLRSH